MGQIKKVTAPNTVLLAVPDLLDHISDMKNSDGSNVNVLLSDLDISLVDLFRENHNQVSAIVIPQNIDIDILDALSQEITKVEKDQLLPLMVIGHVDPQTLSVLRNGILFQSLTLQEAKAQIRALLASTVSEFQRINSLLEDLENNQRVIHLMSKAVFELKTLDEANSLTSFLSAACPKPRLIALGLSELLINAVEHGNLEINFDLKTELLETGTWRQEVEKRARKTEFKDRKVIVTYERNDKEVMITITDEGNGFDWHPYISFSRERLTMKHGRGIALAKETVFNDMRYNEKGNSVTVTMKLD
ncbi:ATP-binding protein [Curvivirga sp.]|uniref:ATP-binding protein n=1 Tax=Curvivirga sp. TaxID=2856848 RepID=UPI003B5C2DC5